MSDAIVTEDRTMEATAVTRMPERENRPAAITPMQMLQIAVEQGADLEKLSKLMDLQERWDANEARKAFVAALNAFKGTPPTLSKNKHVDFSTAKGRTEYWHATLDHVSSEIGKGLSQHGLSHRWEVEQMDGGQIRVTCVLMHERGHSERVSLQAGRDDTGNKNNIQAVGSTVTYLERYTLLAITGLAAADQDDDAVRAVDQLGEGQKEELIRLQKEVGADTAAFLKFLGVASLDELPANRFHEAKTALEAKRRKAQ